MARGSVDRQIPKTGELRRWLAENVRALRERRTMTQTSLARAAGLSRNYVSEVERGGRNVSLDVVEQLAAALSVNPLRLLRAN